MIMRKLFILSFLFAFGLNTFSQNSIEDTTKTIPYLSISYQFFLAGGDLAERYGPGNILGADFNVKMANNFELGLGGGYIFGNIVREDSLLHGMRTSSGEILDDNAIVAEVFFFQRGWKAGMTIAKIFPILGPNPNSGLKAGVGFGYNQQWIRIENQENMIPQLSDELKTYYDRKAGGFYIEEFIGYQLFSNKGFANFIGGFEFRQGFNSEMRSYNIDDMNAVSGNRVDLYYGIKISWNILFYKRMSTSYYIN